MPINSFKISFFNIKTLAIAIVFFWGNSILAQSKSDELQPELEYRFNSGNSWLAVGVLPQVRYSDNVFFWEGHFGTFQDNGSNAAYRLAIGYSRPQLQVIVGFEKNSISALLPYGPEDSSYQAVRGRLAIASESQNISFFADVSHTRMTHGDYLANQIMVVRLGTVLRMINQPIITTEFRSTFDLLFDIGELGNKLALEAELPVQLVLLDSMLMLRFVPRLAHVQRATRIVADGILAALLYRPTSINQATDQAELGGEVFFYPFRRLTTKFLQYWLLAAQAKIGLYYHDPQALENAYPGYQLSFSVGWGELEHGIIGATLSYRPDNQLRLGFYVNGQW